MMYLSYITGIQSGKESLMELRDLEYFLAISRHGTLSGASKALHLTQPALSRSLQHLEDELGKRLMIRGSRRIILTEEGELLRRRAEELIMMAERTVSEIQTPDDVIEGDIYIRSGETKALHFLTQAAKKLLKKHPGVHLNIASGDGSDVMNDLEMGLADFGLAFPPFDIEKYASIRIPYADVWGLSMRKDDPLASKTYITSADIAGKPLIVSREIVTKGNLEHVLNLPQDQINIKATYSLMFNGALMVTDGIGYLLGLGNILNLTGNTVQCFRPLYPAVTQNIHVCWKRFAPMSRQAAALLEEMRRQEHEEVQYLFDPI